MTTPTAWPQLTVEQRREVEELVCRLPGRSNDLSFDEPWEVRAFALVVAAHAAGQFPWSDFQQALTTSIGTWERVVANVKDPSWSYYEHWVTALESVLGSNGVVDPSAVDGRTRDVLGTPPNRNHHEPHYDPVAVDPATRSRQGENS